MKFIKEHIIDIMASAGLALISAGTFKISITVGLIITGIMLIAAAYIISRGGV